MESSGSTPSRFNPHHHHHHHKPSRLLSAFIHVPQPSENLSSVADELNEEDIFTADISQAVPSSSSPLSSSFSGHQNINGHGGGSKSKDSFKTSEVSSGILAALSENSNNDHQFFNHNAAASSTFVSSTVSTSSSSSARLIPSIPKPPQDRIPFLSSPVKFHQSAPVNVPVLKKAMKFRGREFDEVDLNEEEEEGEMLPPHEVVARSLAQSPRLSSSVLEGAGRTLKGRDLRQVRNAVFRKTGFID